MAANIELGLAGSYHLESGTAKYGRLESPYIMGDLRWWTLRYLNQSPEKIIRGGLESALNLK